MSFNESILSKVLARTIVSSDERSDFLAFATPVYCPDLNGVKAEKVFIVQPVEPTTQETDDVNANLITVTLSQQFEFAMTIPHDVDFKTDFNLLNIIRSFAYQMFKHEVSNNIASTMSVNSSMYTTSTAQSSLNKAVGSAFHEFVFNGTGSKFSIYKFDNGAPVVYAVSGNEVKLNKEAVTGFNVDLTMANFFSIYSDKDSNNPAMYLVEKPTLILNEATHETFYHQLASGDIRSALVDKMDVVAAHETIKEDYLGILGTNNAFAVAFTEPRIKIVPSQAEFADVVKVYINYGIALVNPEDLIQIPALTTETP